MATDIVERLRKFRELPGGGPAINQEAADEIERLRAELKRWQDMNGKLLEQNYKFTQLLVEQDTVIKRLQDALKDMP